MFYHVIVAVCMFLVRSDEKKCIQKHTWEPNLLRQKRKPVFDVGFVTEKRGSFSPRTLSLNGPTHQMYSQVYMICSSEGQNCRAYLTFER